MTTAQKSVLGLLLAVALVVAGFALGHLGSCSPVAGAANNNVGYLQQLVSWFSNTVYFGSTQQMSIDSSGNVTTSGTFTSTATTAIVGGVTDTYARSTMTTATTTPCATLVSATSTLESFAANITAGTTTASTLTLATSSTPYATTSVIAQKTVAAGAQVTFDFHPAKDNSVISPGTYVVLGQQGGIGSFSNTGTCTTVTRSAN